MQDVDDLIEVIIDMLSERKGFDNWFSDLDNDIVDDIYYELGQVVTEWMNDHNDNDELEDF
jgi:hypothetical protein